MVGVAPAVQEQTDVVVRRHAIEEIRSGPVGDHRQRQRHAGLPALCQKARELRRRAPGIVVAPPESEVDAGGGGGVQLLARQGKLGRGSRGVPGGRRFQERGHPVDAGFGEKRSRTRALAGRRRAARARSGSSISRAIAAASALGSRCSTSRPVRSSSTSSGIAETLVETHRQAGAPAPPSGRSAGRRGRRCARCATAGRRGPRAPAGRRRRSRSRLPCQVMRSAIPALSACALQPGRQRAAADMIEAPVAILQPGERADQVGEALLLDRAADRDDAERAARRRLAAAPAASERPDRSSP